MPQDTKALIERLEKHGRWWKVGDDKSEQRARDCDRAADALEAAQKLIERYEAALTEIYEYPSGQPIALGLSEEDWQRRRAEQMRFIARTALTGGGIDDW